MKTKKIIKRIDNSIDLEPYLRRLISMCNTMMKSAEDILIYLENGTTQNNELDQKLEIFTKIFGKQNNIMDVLSKTSQIISRIHKIAENCGFDLRGHIEEEIGEFTEEDLENMKIIVEYYKIAGEKKTKKSKEKLLENDNFALPFNLSSSP